MEAPTFGGVRSSWKAFIIAVTVCASDPPDPPAPAQEAAGPSTQSGYNGGLVLWAPLSLPALKN